MLDAGTCLSKLPLRPSGSTGSFLEAAATGGSFLGLLEVGIGLGRRGLMVSRESDGRGRVMESVTQLLMALVESNAIRESMTYVFLISVIPVAPSLAGVIEPAGMSA